MTRVIWTLILAFVMLSTLQSHAQEKPIPMEEAGQSEKPFLLPEIVVKGKREEEARERRLRAVTGTKTDTPVLELPASVGVIDRRQIEEQGATSVMEALENVSGTYVFGSYGGAFPQYVVRGFFGNNVTLLYDGIQEHDNQRGSRDIGLFNIERVEVLKGPASVLYGQGAIGAAVNYVTKKPTPVHTVEGVASYGSFNTMRAGAGAGGPLLEDQLLYRLDLGWAASDGFEDRTEYEKYQASGALTWLMPTQGRLTFSAERRYDDLKPYVGIPLLNGKLAPVRRQNNYNTPDTFNRWNIARGRLLYEQPLGEDFLIRNHVYYFYQEMDYLASEQYTAVLPSTVKRDLLTITRDDDLIGNQLEGVVDFRLGPTEHKVLVGTDFSYNLLQSTRSFGTYPSVDLFNPVDPRVSPTVTRRVATDAEVRKMAFYLQDQVGLTDQWRLVLGLRFDQVDAERRDLLLKTKAGRRFDDFSYRAGIVYLPTPDWSLYASYTTAIKPVVTFDFLSPTNQIFDPEEAEQWEVGVKSTLLDKRLVTTVALFWIDKENLLVDRRTPSGTVTDQIGQQRAKGVEVDLDYQLTSRWRVTANYSLTDPTFVKFTQVSGGVEKDLSGNRPRFIPQQLASLWTTYDLGDGFTAGAGCRYVGDRFAEDSNTTAIDEYLLVDAALFYRWGALEASVHFKNIFDETPFDQALGDPATQLVPGRPFEVMVGLHVTF